MIRYRYSQWDNTQDFVPPRPEDVLEHLGDALLRGGDLRQALRRLLQQGMWDARGRRLYGLQDLLQQLRRRREQLLQRYAPDGVVEDIRRRLDDIVARERQTLEAQLAATRQRLAALEAQGITDAQQRANEMRAVQEMEELVAERRGVLDHLPPRLAERLRHLQQYDFVDRQAREDFAALLQSLQQQAAQALFRSLKAQLQDTSAADMQRLHQMLADLTRLLDRRAAGESADFQAFRDRYRDLLPPDTPADLEAFLAQLAQGMQAMQTLLNSMSPAMRQELQQLLTQLFADEELQQTLQRLMAHLQAYLRQRDAGWPFRGEEALPLPEALELMEQLHAMKALEAQLERALWQEHLEDIAAETVQQVLGDEASSHFRALQELAEQLERRGYVRRSAEKLELTARGIRQIAHKALLDIFASIRRDPFGAHPRRQRGPGSQRLEETKAYEFGDPFDLHLPRTVFNAVQRQARLPLRLTPEDFEVHSREAVSRCATVLLLDMSGSMERFQRFAAAKKVALALDALIRSQFPRDTLHIVGFYTYAHEIKLEDLPYLTPKPFGFFPFMYSDMYYNPMGYLDLQIDTTDVVAGRVEVPQAFTNIQAGLQVAERIFARQRASNKQVILITDGEPTAHMRHNKICLEYPPSQRTLTETLKEVKRCTQRGIVINTFMLGQDYYMERFVHELARLNRGRVFFTSPEDIGDYVLVDYLTQRRKRVR
ncbi:MAG: hypothetical protein KatS3mg131_1065 [Candidatus Tectimicrobiota bacterium]|nr:MAG: hypothetical protein KatS3mg131_1065 [Candidatus Tectomicrobia bacterium]